MSSSVQTVIGLGKTPNSNDIKYLKSPFSIYGVCDSNEDSQNKIVELLSNITIPWSESLHIHVLFKNGNTNDESITIQIGDDEEHIYKICKNNEPYLNIQPGVYEFVLTYPIGDDGTETRWEVVTPTDIGITAQYVQNPQGIGDIGFITTQYVQNPQGIDNIGFITATGNINLTDVIPMYRAVVLNSESEMPATPNPNTFYFIIDS